MPAASLRALLTRTIDYAGLFPPASLDLEPALRNYAEYVRTPERWMLGAFVLPVGKFEVAAQQLSLFAAEHPLEISALGPKTADPSTFAAALETIRKAIETIQKHADGVAVVRQLEMPFPGAAALDSLGEAGRIFHEMKPRVFLEAPPNEAPATIAALAGSGLGFKLRTGGVTADAFPSGAQISCSLVAAARHRVPIKFTAGLHHPVKLFHESVQTKMHGFLNVLGAGVLAAEHGWSETQTEEMLAEEEPHALVFGDDVFRWRDWQISSDQIAVRREFVVSLGSCSFDEPRDDLHALHLL
jgi:hypothetical protein